MNMNISTVPSTLQYNIPEINPSSKLVSKLYSVFCSKGISITEDLLSSILNKLHLDQSETLDTEQLQQIFTMVRKINERQQASSTTSLPPSLLQSQQQSQQQPQPHILPSNPNNVIHKDTSGLFETDTKLVDTILVIDSNDRNTEKWISANPFEIFFGYPSRANQHNEIKGHIDQDYSNVAEIQLLEAIVPSKTFKGDNLSHYPYVLLDIDELGSGFIGSNQHLSKAFAKLILSHSHTSSISSPSVAQYAYYTMSNDDNKKIFSPRISLNKLTFTLRAPDGHILRFEPWMDDTKRIRSNITYTFRIKCWKRSLDTVYIY